MTNIGNRERCVNWIWRSPMIMVIERFVVFVENMWLWGEFLNHSH